VFDANTGIMCLNPCFGGIWSLRKMKEMKWYSIVGCLNPCFGGIWSLSAVGFANSTLQKSLNPCFGGIWSLSKIKKRALSAEAVS